MKKRLLVFFLISIVFLPLTVQAQSSSLTSDLHDLGAASGLPTTDFKEIFFSVVRLLFRLIGVVLFLKLFYAGFVWMFSLGEDEKVDEAKRIITESVVGLVVIVISHSLTTFLVDAITRIIFTSNNERL